MADLPVRKVPGIGRVTEEKMKGLGIQTVGDLRLQKEEDLRAWFGKVGPWYYALARGEDHRAVAVGGARKLIGAEPTFGGDRTDHRDIAQVLAGHGP